MRIVRQPAAQAAPSMAIESELIERIRRAIPSRAAPGGAKGLRLGIGDDAAVVRWSPRADAVLTCDAFLEGVHFLAEVHPARMVGYKALARATSDIAAMGALPRLFLLGLALPAHRTAEWLDDFLAGMSRAARKFGLLLAGGDTARDASITIQITVLGEAPAGRVVARTGARPGDLVCVTGCLGAAQLGLELVLRRLHRARRWHALLRAHFYPPLRLGLGRWLARRRLASAMIDISDGLSTDLAHICQASGVGARIWAEHIPAVRVPRALQKRGIRAQELALHGGEDYELLFTVPRRFEKRVPRAYQGTRITPIGEITAGSEMYMVEPDGHATVLVPRGWDHFRPPR